MIKGITEMKSELCEALYEDLGRCRNQSEVSEITGSINTAKYDLKHIDSWIKSESVDIDLLCAPGSAYVKYEPLGVCLIYGAWNYPLILSFKPIIQCITAGNCALIKPSEMAP